MPIEVNNADTILRVQTVMVIMPHGWKGGFFRVAAALCNLLEEIEYKNQRFRIILGVPIGYECSESYLLNRTVEVTQLSYERVSASDRRFVPDPTVYGELGELPLITPSKTMPYGDTTTLGEIDGYILLSALFHEGVFVTTKPYAVYVADLIQRYVPAIYSDADNGYDAVNWLMDRNQKVAIKRANKVFSTTTQTLTDVTTYGGVHPSRTALFPMFSVDLSETEPESQDGLDESKRVFQLNDIVTGDDFTVEANQYFLWVTNASAHKNHLAGFRALKQYYESLDGRLHCLICGPVTDFLKPGSLTSPYHKSIYTELENWKEFGKRVRLLGYLSDNTYLELLKCSRFLWHNVIYDNGTFSIMEAARVGTPSLSSDYPQMRFIDETFNLNSRFFPSDDPFSAAKALKGMEAARRPNPKSIKTADTSEELHKAMLSLLDAMFVS